MKQLQQLVDHLWLYGLPEEMEVLTESDRYYNDASHVLYATCTDRIQVYLSRALWYVDLQITVVVSFLLPFTYQTKPSVQWRCWLGVRKSIWPVKIEWWGASMVICLEWAANDTHGPADGTDSPIISCFIKIQTGLTLLLPAYPCCLAKEAVKLLSVVDIKEHSKLLHSGTRNVGQCPAWWTPCRI